MHWKIEASEMIGKLYCLIQGFLAIQYIDLKCIICQSIQSFNQSSQSFKFTYSSQNSYQLSMKILLCILLVLAVVMPRKIYRDLSGTQMRKLKGWIFLDRIVLDSGMIDLSLNVELKTSYTKPNDEFEIELLLVSDSIWQLLKENEQCQWRKTYISGESQQSVINTVARFGKNIGMSGQSTSQFRINEETTYHIVLADCKKTLINEYFNKKSQLKVIADVTSENQSHGKDQSLYTWWLPLLAILAIISYRYLDSVKNEEFRETDYPRIFLKVSIFFNTLSLVLSFVHHLFYILIQGSHFKFLQFIEALIDPISDTTLLTLLVFLAYGWYTKVFQFKDSEISYVVAIMMSFSFVIVNALTKINDGEAGKYHFHDSIPSKILIGYLMLILVLFYFGIAYTGNNSPWKKKTKQTIAFSDYQLNLAVIGTFACLYMPIIVFVSDEVSPGWRQAFVFLSLRICRIILLISTAWMLTHRKSAYRKICLIDKSFLVDEKGF